MSDYTETTSELPTEFLPKNYADEHNNTPDDVSFWEDDPYDSARSWVAHRRSLAEERWREDGLHTTSEDERPDESHYPYGPGFASFFAHIIGGSLDDLTVMPTPPAVVAYLEEVHSKWLERPDCDYLITILEEAYSNPTRRVIAALEWLKHRQDILRPWPPELRIGGLLIRTAKPGPYNTESISSAAEQVLPSTNERKAGFTYRQIALFSYYLGRKITEHRAAEVAAYFGKSAPSSGQMLFDAWEKECANDELIKVRPSRAAKAIIRDIATVAELLPADKAQKASKDIKDILDKIEN